MLAVQPSRGAMIGGLTTVGSQWWVAAMGRNARSFHGMKSSFPSLRTLRDPSKPNVAKIIREMEHNRNEGQGAILKREPQKPGGSGLSSGTGTDATETRTHSTLLPEGVFPSAAATPAAASIPRGPASVMGAGVGSPGSPSSRRVNRGAAEWHPPGWDDFAKQRSLPTSSSKGKYKTKKDRDRDKLGRETPSFEVWGMRAVGVLLFAVFCLEVKDLSWGPAGLTKKAAPRRIQDE